MKNMSRRNNGMQEESDREIVEEDERGVSLAQV